MLFFGDIHTYTQNYVIADGGSLQFISVLQGENFVAIFVGPLSRVRPRNGILALGLVVVLPLRSEFIGEL